MRGSVTFSPALRKSFVSKTSSPLALAAVIPAFGYDAAPVQPVQPTNPSQNMLSNRNYFVRCGVLGLFLSLMLAASGCVYRIDIQQGNFLEDKDLDRVAVGMTRVQVRSLLGTPMVADPFNSSRWDYVYYLKRGRLQKPLQRQFTVHFDDDKVTRIDRTSGADSKSDSAA